MRVLRVIAVGVLAGVLAAVLLRTSGRFGAAQPADRAVAPRTADQVRTEELFRLNADLPSDPALDSAYRSINAQYFDNRLPAVRLRWEPRLEEVGPLIADGFRMGGVTDGRLILMNPVLEGNDEEFRRVLCHEIVHIAVVAERDPHGPVFQRYLRLLATRGAFAGIVATDVEKQEARRRLDRLASDLAREADALSRGKTELEAAAAPAGDLSARAAEHNLRVRRHNDAVVEFNRDVEDYNQMVSYPDGLDRERLARHPAVPPRHP